MLAGRASFRFLAVSKDEMSELFQSQPKHMQVAFWAGWSWAGPRRRYSITPPPLQAPPKQSPGVGRLPVQSGFACRHQSECQPVKQVVTGLYFYVQIALDRVLKSQEFVLSNPRVFAVIMLRILSRPNQGIPCLSSHPLREVALDSSKPSAVLLSNSSIKRNSAVDCLSHVL
jgi:hypothetical protein